MKLARFALLLALVCRTVFADSGGAIPSYDGSRAGFVQLAAELGVDWPAPKVMDSFSSADGASMRWAHWAAANNTPRKGVVVFFSGRTEFIEKNIYTYRDLRNRGYDIWTFDWRGQGLSTRQVKTKPHLGHIDHFNTFVADAEQFINEIVQLDRYASEAKILMAHSMGGAIATLYLQKHQQTFDVAVFSAPMLGLSGSAEFLSSIQIVGGPETCAGKWFGRCYWENNVKAAVPLCDFSVPVSVASFPHDYQKLRQIHCMIEAGRSGATAVDLGLGRPTIGWVRQAIAATKNIYNNAAKLQTPMLIVGGGNEKVVSNKSQQAFCRAAGEYCEREEIPAASHEILIETGAARDRFFQHFDEFVAKHLRK